MRSKSHPFHHIFLWFNAIRVDTIRLIVHFSYIFINLLQLRCSLNSCHFANSTSLDEHFRKNFASCQPKDTPTLAFHTNELMDSLVHVMNSFFDSFMSCLKSKRNATKQNETKRKEQTNSASEKQQVTCVPFLYTYLSCYCH